MTFAGRTEWQWGCTLKVNSRFPTFGLFWGSSGGRNPFEVQNVSTFENGSSAQTGGRKVAENITHNDRIGSGLFNLSDTSSPKITWSFCMATQLE